MHLSTLPVSVDDLVARQGEGSRSGANRAQNAARAVLLVWHAWWSCVGGAQLGRFGVIGVTKHAYSSPLFTMRHERDPDR